jgi:hypothetical protein
LFEPNNNLFVETTRKKNEGETKPTANTQFVTNVESTLLLYRINCIARSDIPKATQAS